MMAFLIMLVLEQTATAKQPARPAEATAYTWQVREDLHEEQFEKRYYVLTGCSVWVRRDHKGVHVTASRTDPPSSHSFSYTDVDIVNGEVKVQNGRTIFLPKGGVLLDQSNFNLFYPQCGKYLKELPVEVRKLFFGYGGAD